MRNLTKNYTCTKTKTPWTKRHLSNRCTIFRTCSRTITTILKFHNPLKAELIEFQLEVPDKIIPQLWEIQIYRIKENTKNQMRLLRATGPYKRQWAGKRMVWQTILNRKHMAATKVTNQEMVQVGLLLMQLCIVQEGPLVHIITIAKQDHELKDAFHHQSQF